MGEDNSDAPGFLAIVVAQTNGRASTPQDLLNQRQVADQLIEVEAYRQAYSMGAFEPVLLRRGTGPFDPSTDPNWDRISRSAQNNRAVAIDDFRRLIDFTNSKIAVERILELVRSLPTLYSIVHGTHLRGFTKERIRQIVLSQTDKKMRRSKAGQQAAQTAGPDVRKVVSARANAGKSRKADHIAGTLVPKIEEIRSHLPAHEKDNKAAIARALQDAGIPTPTGRGSWQSTTVARIYKRADRPFASNTKGTEQAASNETEQSTATK